MRTEGTALRLTVYLGESHQWHHRPVYAEVVRRARDAGLAGAAVFRGFEGYGASRELHTARVLSLTEDLPVTVVIVDSPQRVREFLASLDDVITHGMVTLEEVHAVRYADPADPAGPADPADPLNPAGPADPAGPENASGGRSGGLGDHPGGGE